MADEAELEAKFWRALRADMTFLLGIKGMAPAQPMTAQFDETTQGSSLWVFTTKDNDMVRALDANRAAFAYFVSKGHDLFAALDGTLEIESDKAMIERLWNPFVAAWFEGGKDDPKLALIRFDPAHAQIWLNDHSFLAGVKLLLGRDPKKDYAGKVGEVRL